MYYSGWPLTLSQMDKFPILSNISYYVIFIGVYVDPSALAIFAWVRRNWNLHVRIDLDIYFRLFMKKNEGLDGGGGVWNSLISKNLAHYSLSLKFLLIL